MKESIMAWLHGPREFNEGVALYKLYGYNKVLKKQFDNGFSHAKHEMLQYELGKMVGLTQKDISMMTRNYDDNSNKVVNASEPAKPVSSSEMMLDDMLLSIAGKLGVGVDIILDGTVPDSASDEQKTVFEQLLPSIKAIPETQKEIIRFREKFDFLKEESCPDVLKIMVSDMFAAYDKYREARMALSESNSSDENAELAKKTVDNYLSNRKMWEELEYYKENREILGKHPVFEKYNFEKELKSLSDLDVAKKHQNAKSNISKNKANIAKAENDDDKKKYEEALENWTEKQNAYASEIELRKKATRAN